jgi:hypothetical protein
MPPRSGEWQPTGSDIAANIECAGRAVTALSEGNAFDEIVEAPLSDQIRESARSALDLQVLGRGLATIGDLFVLDALPFIK